SEGHCLKIAPIGRFNGEAVDAKAEFRAVVLKLCDRGFGDDGELEAQFIGLPATIQPLEIIKRIVGPERADPFDLITHSFIKMSLGGVWQGQRPNEALTFTDDANHIDVLPSGCRIDDISQATESFLRHIWIGNRFLEQTLLACRDGDLGDRSAWS